MMLWVSFVVGLLTCGVGVAVFFSNRRGRANQIFLLYAILVGAWVIFNSAALYAPDDKSSLLFVRLVMAFTAPVFPTLFMLAKAYPNGSLNLKFWQKMLILVITIAAILAALSPFTFVGVDRSGGGTVPRPGPLIAIYALNVIIFTPWALITFIKRWRRTKGLGQLQLKYVLSGLMIAVLVVTLTNFVLVVIFNNANFVEIGPLLGALFMVIIPSYPILQQRLFGLEFILGKIIYSVSLIALVFGMLILFFHWHVALIESEYLWFWLLLMATFLTIVLLWFSRLVHDLISTNFVHHGRNFTKLRQQFLQKVSREASLEIIVNQLFDVTAYTLGIKKQAVLLATDEDWHSRFILQRRLAAAQLTTAEERLIRNFWDNSLASEQPIIAQENIVHKLPLEIQDGYVQIKKLMSKYKVGIAFPIFINNNYQGALLFGNKENNIAFFAQDIDYLQELVDATIPILGRAILYERMNKFNSLLRTQVNKKNRDLGKAYQELETAYVKLQRLDKTKDDFVSVASHELRTPMTAIRNSIFMAKREPEVKPETRLARFLDITYGSTERLIRLVNDMLTISRMEAGKTQFKMERFNLLDLATKVHSEVESIAHDKGIYFKISAAKKNYFIKGDQEKLHEVIMNLVGNALKFTHQGGVKIMIKTEGRRVYLTVQDTGIGIKSDDINKLFEKFTKLETSYVKVDENGTGLGLNIAKQIIEKHRGKIYVESEFGRGSAFICHFPEIE